MSTIKKLALLIAGCVLVVSYNNCANHRGFRSLSSEEMAACDQELKNLYKEVYYGYITRSNNCLSCHNEAGGSPFKFAAQDFELAFRAFNKKGHALLYRKAIDPAHAKDVTGPRHQQPFDTMGQFWTVGQDLHEACYTGAKVNDGAVQTTGKYAENLYFTNNQTQKLIWNLGEAKDRRADDPAIYMTVDMTVALGFTNGNPDGYEIRELILTPTRGSDRIVLDGLFLFVNGGLIPEAEALGKIQQVVMGSDPVRIVGPGTGISSVKVAGLPKVTSRDEISLRLRNIRQTNRTDPIPDPPPAQLLSAVTGIGDAGFFGPDESTATVSLRLQPSIRRFCISSSPNRPISPSAGCLGREGLQNLDANGWNLVSNVNNQVQDVSTNFDLTPLAGATNGNRYTYYIWTASADLVVSSQPTTFQFTYDDQAPTAPNLVDFSYVQVAGSPNLIDGQSGYPVVFLSIDESQSGNFKEWCVTERIFNSVDPGDSNPESGGCRWIGVKPGTYAVAGGSRVRVGVFLRDAAGNISTAVGGDNNPRVRTKSNMLTGQTASTFEVDSSQLGTLSGGNGFNRIAGNGAGLDTRAMAIMRAPGTMTRNSWTSAPFGAGGALVDLTVKSNFDGSSAVRSSIKQALRNQGPQAGIFNLTEAQRETLLWYYRHNFNDADNW